MDRAIVFVGREGSGENYTEHYSLLVGDRFVSTHYVRNTTHDPHFDFLNTLADEFGEAIAAGLSPLEVDILQGYRLDPSRASGSTVVKVDRLDAEVVQNFSAKITQKIRDLLQGRALVLVAHNGGIVSNEYTKLRFIQLG